MRNLFSAALIAGAALLAACTTTSTTPPPALTAEARAPVTILVSIDGFRSDYLDPAVTPVLSGLAADGVTAPLQPAFPTKTFPNHYTLVTGLVPDRHGIVGNRFEDPEHPGDVFTLPRLESFWWEEATPIWVSAEQAGIRTATMFWPGSNAEIHGTYPRDWQQFSMEVTGRQRVDAIIDWLRRPAGTRPRLLTLYFDTVDTAGHHHGPDAPETKAALGEVDALIGRLVDDLAALGQPANLIVTSDHGMAPVSAARVIRIDQIADPSLFRVIESGPYAALEPTEGNDAALAARLLKPHAHMQCWRRADIPARFQYGRNPRTPSFLCLGESGWTITNRDLPAGYGGGAHGYDNQDPAMRALFVAHGPAFAQSKTLPRADSVDVYPLLRRLIGLPPATGIDGDDELIAALK